MTSHRRRAPPGGGQFTFAASPDRRDGAHGAVEYDAWAERIRGGNGYFGKSDDLKLGAWTARGASSFGGREPVGQKKEKEEGASGARSPPLWKKAGSPRRTEARGRHVDAGSYPTAEAREIARYRQEMLDMVKDLPESGYELSLKDMVVQPATPTRTPPRAPIAEVETPMKGSPEKASKTGGKDRKGAEKGVKELPRSENVEGGAFLLKLVMPVAIGGGRRKSTSGGSNSRKVSPKPSFEAEKGVLDGSDGEWWRNNELSGSGGSNSSSDNSNTSSNSSSSSSSSSSNRSRKMRGCYPFLLRDKK